MTSKELNEILNKTRRTKDISLTPEQVEELIKDLEELEKQDKMLNSMSNYTLAYKGDGEMGFVIEMWSDFKGFENVKDWVEKIYQNDKKIERKFNEDGNSKNK